MFLELQKQESILTSKIYYETVDMNLLNRLIDSQLLNTEKKENSIYENENEKAQLMAYRNNLTKNGIRVKYKGTKSGFGRVYPVKSLSLCSFRREIRHTIAKEKYVDIDVFNCHPSLLYQICVKNNVFPPNLKRYIDERDVILQEVMNEYNVSREDAKDLFIRLLFFGSFDKWAKEMFVVDKKKVPLPFISSFQQDLISIANLIMGSNAELIKEIKKSKDKFENEKGSVVSYFLHEWERRILETMYKYLVDKKVIHNNVVLCFDGLMIPLDKYNDGLIGELEEEVKKKICLEIKLAKKEMDMGINKQLDEELKEKEEEMVERLNELENFSTFDPDYLKNLKTYVEKKKYFEKFVCKISVPDGLFVFSQEVKDEKNNFNQTFILSKSNILDAFNEYKIEEDMTIDKYGKEKRKSFIKRWVDDPDIHKFINMDFLPSNFIYGSEVPKSNTYNLFKGYNPVILKGYNKSKRQDILKAFKMLGKEICGGNEEHFSYLMKFFAHMIQKPTEKIPVAFLIKGKQGAGKNVFLQAICNLLDKRNYISSSKAKDFFGDYAEGFHNKLLVNINECEGKDTFDYEGLIKSIITENTFTLNAKFERPVIVKNFARLIFFTNKWIALPIDIISGNRRISVFKTTDHYLDKKYTEVFWKLLVKHFESPEFISALYDELNEMDIENFDFKKNRPITEAYKEMCKQFLPNLALFFEYIIDSNIYESYMKKGVISIRSSEVYIKYIEWSKLVGFNKYEPNIKNFYGKITELELPIHLYKKEGVPTLKFDPIELYNYLKKKKWVLHDDIDEEQDEKEDDHLSHLNLEELSYILNR